MKLFRIQPWKAGLVSLSVACALFAQPAAGLHGFGGFAGRFGLGGGLLHGTVTGAPFSATQATQTQRTLANGTQIQNQHQSKVYRDAQGRVRIDTTINRMSTSGGGATTQTFTTIYDPVGGSIYRLNPNKMTAVQSPIPSQAAPTGTKPTHAPPAGVQVQTQSLGTSTINGVTATGTQVTTTIAAATIGNSAPIQIVRVTWVSTQLQIPVQVSVSDPRFGNSLMNLTNIVQTPPDESLFQVPAGYAVTQAPARPAGRNAFRH